jgi:predicted alpha/beta hydrolase family esterase
MSKPVDHVVMIHGYGVSANSIWFPWLQREIEKRGVAVTAPSLPSPLRPDFKRWMETFAPIAGRWTPQTVVIAHSLGGALALRLLEFAAQKKVRAVILVSPLFASLMNVRELLEFFDCSIDWKKLRKSSREFVVIQAKDDPLVPFDHALRHQEFLNADLHLLNKGGHFTAKKFPLLLKSVKKYLE